MQHFPPLGRDMFIFTIRGAFLQSLLVYKFFVRFQMEPSTMDFEHYQETYNKVNKKMKYLETRHPI